MNITKEKRKLYFDWSVWCAFLFLLFSLLPPTGDDFFFRTPRSFSAFLETQRNLYFSENGRIIGNALAYTFAEFTILAALFKTIIVFAITYNINKLIGNTSRALRYFSFFLCLVIPTTIFSQTYAWSAGFYNYVPPILILLLSLRLVFPIILEKQYVPTKYSSCLLLLGFTGCFFAEFFTTYTLCFSISIFVLYFIKERTISKPLLCYSIGSIAGLIIMFLSPVYHRVASNADAYRTISLSIEDIFIRIRENYEAVSSLTISKNYIIVLLLSVLSYVLIIKKKTFASLICKILLIAVPIYYLFSTIILMPNFSIATSSLAFILDFAVCITYFIANIYALHFGLEEQKFRCFCILLLISIALLNGPLLLVTPIGPRCFYISYIILVTLILLMCKYVLEQYTISMETFLLPCSITLLLFMSSSLFIAYHQHRVYTQKCNYIEKQMRIGNTIIDVPCYEYPDYIHEPETDKISYVYYYEKPFDITWNYIPYKEWHYNIISKD